MGQRRTAIVIIGAVVVASVVSFIAGSRITSPAEVASRTAAPDPSLILVPVEDRVLSTEVVTRGTGRFGSPQKLSVPTSALKSSAGLVAQLPVAGAQLIEGDVVASGSGRPLFLLVGQRPMSRDLGPGLSGDDVRQLETSLSRLGFDPGPVDGVYDAQTETAVETWYLANGYSPVTATDDQLSSIRAREAELASAAVELTVATDALSSANAALTTARVDSTAALRHSEASSRAVRRAEREAAAADKLATEEVAARQAAVDSLRAGVRAAPATPAELRAAESDVVAARANEASVLAAGERAVADAQLDVDQAPARLAMATSAAALADDVAAADVGARQAALDELVVSSSSTAAEVAVAQFDLATAEANEQAVHAAGEQAVADALIFVANAPSVLELVRLRAVADNDAATAELAAKELALQNLTTPPVPTSAEIAAAEHDLAVAVANRETVRLAGERSVDEATTAAADASDVVTVAAAAVGAADDGLNAARTMLASRSDIETLAAQEADLAHRRAGVQVPADEVAFVAVGPVRVSEVLLVIGDPLTGAVAMVTDSLVHVDAGLALGDAELVTTGMTVQIDEPDLGITAEGVVDAVAAAPGTNGVDGFHVYISIDVEAPPANLVGASVRLTIPVDSSGESVLAVPVSALTLAADGSSRVQQSRGGATEFVTVLPGLSAAGYVGVSDPTGRLQSGDLVVIGVEPPSSVNTSGGTGG
jgi:peptidoglycan hydrolase-like protein with peptidoglycan-binding domain